MKKRSRDFDIFNLSFLDVISCGLGAVVLLVLISKPTEHLSPTVDDEAYALLDKVMAAERRIEAMESDIVQRQAEISAKSVLIDRLKAQREVARSEALGASAQNEDMADRLDGLEVVKNSLKKASVTKRTSTVRDVEVGGIPVDSDYVVFIIDTSGSMLQYWGRVLKELTNVIDIHPTLRGFQVLNDNGAHLISGYAGRWIPDTPQMRKSTLKLLETWNSASNSSPVEGLEVALKSYAKPGVKLSIYIFGDEYSGGSYDPVINTLERQNTNRITGERLAKIHAVGFNTDHTTSRFAILMREVTQRSGGTFIALPK